MLFRSGKPTLKPIKSPALLLDRHRHFVATHPAATRPQARSESASSAESQLLICPPIVCGFSPPSAFSASAKNRRAAVARPCPLFRRLGSSPAAIHAGVGFNQHEGRPRLSVPRHAPPNLPFPKPITVWIPHARQSPSECLDRRNPFLLPSLKPIP